MTGMKIRNILQCIPLVGALIFSTGCTSESGTIGIISDEEDVTSEYKEFGATTSTEVIGAVRKSSGNCYLGCIEDPETGDTIRASFATQFHTFEDFKFPDHQLLFPQDGADHSGDLVSCDSVEVRIFFNNYYGDASNPMKLDVYQLDPAKVIREDTTYLSDTDLMEQFVASGATPFVTKTFAPIDYTVNDTELNSSSHTHSIRIPMPKSLGSDIMNAYYAEPANFRSSYTFIRKVFPGLYFRMRSGMGTMISASVTTLNIYFSYYSTKEKKTVNGFCRFSATPEVMQCSQITRNVSVAEMEANYPGCTFLKTPAGLCTEVTLPIEQIAAGHETDSINRATIDFKAYVAREDATTKMSAPTRLLMVRKQDAKDFFKEHKVTDSQTSFTTIFSTAANNYTFNNIGPLISRCIKEKRDGEAGEDWNKVLLIPVTVSTTTDANGSNVEVSVSHEMSLCSTRLEQGTAENPIPLRVVYSKFK